MDDVAVVVVASGHDRWSSVVHSPDQLAAAWPLESAGVLLAVVSESYEAITGNPWVWAYHDHEADVVPERDAPRRTPWLLLHADFEDLRLRDEVDWTWVRRRKRPYVERIHSLREQLATFDKVGPRFSDIKPTLWSEWWTAERGPAALLHCHITFKVSATKGRHTVRIGESWNQAEQITARSIYPISELDEPPERMADLASRHAGEILTRVIHRLKASQPPPLPDVS